MSSEILVYLLIVFLAILIGVIVGLGLFIFRQRKVLNTYENWFNAFPDPEVVLDERQHILMVNPAAERLIGLTAAEAANQPFQEVFPHLHEKFSHFNEEKQRPFEIELKSSGHIRWYQLISLPLGDKNNPSKYRLVVIQDISTRKHLESALEAAQIMYRSVTDQADDGIAIIQDDLIVQVNPRLLAMTGYLPGDLINQGFEFLIPPEDVQKARLRYQRRIQGDTTPINFETTIKRKDTTNLPVEIKIGLMKFHGKRAVLAMVQDISERKQAEKQLRLQSKAMQAAANAFMITDNNGMIEWVNPAFTKMTGYTFEDVKGRNPRFLKSGRHASKFYQQLWATIKAGRVWRGELINQRKDMELFDEQMTIAPVMDESGEISHFVAIKENITERKQAEKALQKSEKQFRELVWNTPVPMKVYGNDHTLILVNWKFTHTFGYLAEDIPTLEHWWELAIPNERRREQIREEWLHKFKRGLVESSGQQPIEADVICKDGTTRYVRFSWVPIDDKYIVTLMDRTKQIRAEKHLRQEARNSLLLNQITRSALEAIDLESLCQVLADQMGELFNADGCYITLWNENEQKVIPMAAYGPIRESYPTLVLPIKNEPTLTESVLKTGEVIIVENVFHSPYVSARVAAHFPTRSMLGLPLIANQERLGAALISYEKPYIFTPDEIALGERVAAQIALSIAKTKLFGEIHQMAILDSLTGSFTRRHILESSVKEVERAARYGHSICAMMLDVDHFKEINDTFGHQIGDQVLQKVIALCKDNLRKLDLIGRYGGDEFFILLPQIQLQDVLIVAERIRKKIEKMNIQSKIGLVSVTVSIGASCLEMNMANSPEENLHQLIHSTDKALYAAKEMGRNRVGHYPEL